MKTPVKKSKKNRFSRRKFHNKHHKNRQSTFDFSNKMIYNKHNVSKGEM